MYMYAQTAARIMICNMVIPQEPGYESGDIIIVLDEQDHRVFSRKGADLLIKQVSPCPSLLQRVCVSLLYAALPEIAPRRRQCVYTAHMYVHVLLLSAETESFKAIQRMCVFTV